MADPTVPVEISDLLQEDRRFPPSAAFRGQANVPDESVYARADADPEQFASDLNGVMLAFYQANRLLSDPTAETRARTAVDALLRAARA